MSIDAWEIDKKNELMLNEISKILKNDGFVKIVKWQEVFDMWDVLRFIQKRIENYKDNESIVFNNNEIIIEWIFHLINPEYNSHRENIKRWEHRILNTDIRYQSYNNLYNVLTVLKYYNWDN